MQTTQVQEALLSLLERAHQAQQEWIADLSPAERETIGTPEEWSPKDMLAHTTFWQQVTVERLAAAQRGTEPPKYDDFQTVNEQIFEERREHTWQQVVDDAQHTYAALIEQVRNLDEQALTDPQRFAWNNGRALASSILGNGHWHPLEHVARHYFAHGEPVRASELLERTVVREPALEVLPQDRGAGLYNLACLYATLGHPEKALPLLPDALRLRPDLIEWSKQDSDLDVLRGEPAFKALY